MAQAGAGGVGGGYSSSVELSSPPSETEIPTSMSPTPSRQLSSAAHAVDETSRVGGYPTNYPDSASLFASATPQPQSADGASHTPTPQPAKEKKLRKKRDPAAPKPDKVPRKPRTASTASAPKRKTKADATASSATTHAAAPTRQPRITELVLKEELPKPAAMDGRPTPSSAALTQNDFTMPSEAMRSPMPQYPQQQQLSQYAPVSNNPPQQRTSGLNYDPVRSVMVAAPVHPTYQPNPPASPAPSTSVYRPSPSPHISHLIDPVPQPSLQAESSSDALTRAAIRSPHAQHSFPNPSTGVSNSMASTLTLTKASTANGTSASCAMEIDDSDPASTKPVPLIKKGSSEAAPLAAPSPKPVKERAKEMPPPIPQGSGLLSSSMFGGDSGKDASSSTEAPNVILHVPLKGKSNVIFSFAKMAEEKYGFDRLYPRLAANRMRLAKVAAASDALEKVNGSKNGGTSAEESGADDVSVDIERDSDNDNDGDVAMSGVNGGTGTAANSETDGKGTKRKRRRKEEQYDLDGKKMERGTQDHSLTEFVQMTSLMTVSCNGSSSRLRQPRDGLSTVERLFRRLRNHPLRSPANRNAAVVADGALEGVLGLVAVVVPKQAKVVPVGAVVLQVEAEQPEDQEGRKQGRRDRERLRSLRR